MKKKVFKALVIILGVIIAVSLTAFFAICLVTANIDNEPFIEVYKDKIEWVNILAACLCAYLALLFYWISKVSTEKAIHSNGSIINKALVNSYDEVSIFYPDTMKVELVRNFKGYQNVVDYLKQWPDYSMKREKYCEKYVIDEDKEHFLKMTDPTYVIRELQNKISYRVNYKVRIDGVLHSYSIRYAREVMNEKDIIIMAIRNADNDIADEVVRNAELSSMLRQAEVYRKAIYSNAIGYFEADITDDVFLGDYFEVVDGKPIPSKNYNSLPRPIPYSLFINYVADNMLASGYDSFLNTFSRENQLELAKREILFSEGDASIRSRKDKSLKYIHIETFLRKKTSNEHIVMVCVTTDVTEREKEKNLLEQKKNAEDLARIKTETFATMTHDIKTPVTSIISLNEVLRENIDDHDHDKALETIDKIDMASKHLFSLVENIQAYAKLEKGRMELAKKQFDIEDFIDEFKVLMEGACAGRELNIVIEHDQFLHESLIGDELHLRQILINLLSNAVKATPDGGTIAFHVHELSSNDEKELLQFEMIDSGSGIDEQIKSVLFTDLQTTGLGTQIARKFTELMDGSIHAESEKGKGTVITAIIPFQVFNDKKASEKATSVGLRGLKLLIAEDDELSRDMMKETLENSGAIVTATSNGKNALEVFLDSDINYFDGILTDIMMPMMDGFEFARRVRSSAKPCALSIPIIAISYDENTKNSIEENGIDACIEKPIDLTVFIKTLFSCTRSRSEKLASRLENAMSLANKDSLTGVKNATAYKELVREIDAKIQSGIKPDFAIVQCDVNNLKKTNDTFGHDAGDVLIKSCCNQICSIFKHSPVFRTGGDEFVVILENIDFIRRDSLYKQAVKYNKDNLKSSFACGIAVYNPIIDSNVQAVVKRADKAMYDNKQALKSGRL